MAEREEFLQRRPEPVEAEPPPGELKPTLPPRARPRPNLADPSPESLLAPTEARAELAPPAASSPAVLPVDRGEGRHSQAIREDRALEHSLAPDEGGEPPPREVLEDYEELEVLGTGGAGVVTRARERSSGRFVAIKRLRKPIDRERFLNEATAIASLDHPGIVKLHTVVGGPLRTAPCSPLALILELVEGSDLKRLVVSNGRFSLAEALELGVQIADALVHAHTRGVIHRDVKPSNVILDAEGRARLADFGLALSIEAQLSLTATGAVLGTPSYMAPEQLGSAHRVDARADVYGLGATLYRLLTGRSPRVIREAYLPPQVADLVLRCVEEEPRERYPDMATLRRALASALAKVRQDASGIHDPLERAIEHAQRQLQAGQRGDLSQRFLAAVAGLANLDLVPAQSPKRLRSRLDLGEAWPSLIDDLVDEVLLTASARPELRARLLRDAHALLSAALSRSPEARPQLRRILDAARLVNRVPPSVRLGQLLERLVHERALSPADLEAISKRSGPGRVVLESVLARLRSRADAGSNPLQATRRARSALRELQLLIPEWAPRVAEEDLALALREASERRRLAASADPTDDLREAEDSEPSESPSSEVAPSEAPSPPD